MDAEDCFVECMETISDAVDIWQGSAYEPIRRLSLTYRGDVGESFFQLYCEENQPEFTCYTSFNRPDLVPAHISYDALLQSNAVLDYYEEKMGRDRDEIANFIRIEIKTATLDVNGRFQFNNVRDDDWDYFLGIGVHPNHLQIAILSKQDLFRRSWSEMASTAEGNRKFTFSPSEMGDFADFDEIFAETFYEVE